MNPLRTGMIPRNCPAARLMRPGTPTLAKFLLDLGYTGESARTISATTPTRCDRAWFPESGLPVSLDAMQA